MAACIKVEGWDPEAVIVFFCAAETNAFNKKSFFRKEAQVLKTGLGGENGFSRITRETAPLNSGVKALIKNSPQEKNLSL